MFNLKLDASFLFFLQKKGVPVGDKWHAYSFSSSYTKAVNADPPTEAVLLVLVIVIGCGVSLFHSTSDDTGKGLDILEALTMPLFHDMISKLTLGWIRVSIALGIFATTYYRIFHIKG